MPKIIETVKNFFGKEPHRGVNPDERGSPVERRRRLEHDPMLDEIGLRLAGIPFVHFR